jgi:AcrR family transcriptional regulator
MWYNLKMMKKISSNQRRGRPTTRNRSHVLESAMQAYWQADGADISVNAICFLSGVSKPSLYRDFGSEDGLTAAVLKRYAETVLRSLEERVSSSESFKEKIEWFIQFGSESPEIGCLLVKMRANRFRFGSLTQAKIAKIEAHFLECYTRFFKQSASSGEWRGSIAPELAADYLTEQLKLAISQRSAGKSKESVRDLLSLSISVLY